ncbi:MAG TPA: hypothetical protein VMZ22_02850 [Acidimicrobiales bacterium]|nr:hypothetical protein [Acidimicrobiales bacterium]
MAKLTSGPAAAEGTAPIPADNLPGHHPEVEQDKPTRPPKLPPRHHRSALRRDEPFATASRLFGVTSDNSYVEVHEEELEIRFGPWQLKTSLDNIESVQESGPFKWWKVIGGPRLSLLDRGITFATSAQGGVCIRFCEPVPGLEPRGVIRHPGATVTVDDPEALVRFIENARSVVR